MSNSVCDVPKSTTDDTITTIPVNGAPPGQIQTLVTKQNIVKNPKSPSIQPKAAIANTGLKMGNQQGSDSSGKTSSKKKRGSKKSSEKSSGSPKKGKASPATSKKASQSPNKAALVTHPVQQVAGASLLETSITSDVFSEAVDQIEESVQNVSTEKSKRRESSSGDNTSFQSFATPLSTPQIHRAKQTSPTCTAVDRVDELGKSIQRTIIERFSGTSSEPFPKDVMPPSSHDLPDLPQIPITKEEVNQQKSGNAPSRLLSSVKPTSNGGATQRVDLHKDSHAKANDDSSEAVCKAEVMVTPTADNKAEAAICDKILVETKETAKETVIQVESSEMTPGVAADNMSEPRAMNSYMTDRPDKRTEKGMSQEKAVEISESISEHQYLVDDISSAQSILEGLTSVNSSNEPDARGKALIDFKISPKTTEEECVVMSKVTRNASHLASSIQSDTTTLKQKTTNEGSLTQETLMNTSDGNSNGESSLETIKSELTALFISEKDIASHEENVQSVTDIVTPECNAQSVTGISTPQSNLQSVTDIHTPQGKVQSVTDISTSICNVQSVKNIFTPEDSVQSVIDISTHKDSVQSEKDIFTPDGNTQILTDISTPQDSVQNVTGISTPQANIKRVTNIFPHEGNVQNVTDISTSKDSVQSVTDISTPKDNGQNVSSVAEHKKPATDVISNKTIGENSNNITSAEQLGTHKPSISNSDTKSTPAAKSEFRKSFTNDPLMDNLLMLIKQTLEADDTDYQGDVSAVAKPDRSELMTAKETNPCVTETGETLFLSADGDEDKTLTPEDMKAFKQLKSRPTMDTDDIGNADDDTLTAEDLAEFNRIKKIVLKADSGTENQTENEDELSYSSTDKFELSSGETTEDSVIERPAKKVSVLAATQEEDGCQGPAVDSVPSSVLLGENNDKFSTQDNVEHSRVDDYVDSPNLDKSHAEARKRSLTEEEIRREIRKFMIPEMKEALPNTGSLNRMLDDLHDITPGSDHYPDFEDGDGAVSPEYGIRSGLRSRTSITSSELDISEHRDDVSTDSMYADDEDDSSSEVLFCKTYTEPERGTEVMVSCTVVNSALKKDRCSSDEFWAESSAAEDAYQQVEVAADAVNKHFTHARSQMQDIQHHLQALRHQMQHMEKQVVKTYTIPSTDDYDFEEPERRAITD